MSYCNNNMIKQINESSFDLTVSYINYLKISMNILLTMVLWLSLLYICCIYSTKIDSPPKPILISISLKKNVSYGSKH